MIYEPSPSGRRALAFEERTQKIKQAIQTSQHYCTLVPPLDALELQRQRQIDHSSSNADRDAGNGASAEPRTPGG